MQDIQHVQIVLNETDCKYTLMDDYNELEHGTLSEEEIDLLIHQSNELSTMISKGEVK